MVDIKEQKLSIQPNTLFPPRRAIISSAIWTVWSGMRARPTACHARDLSIAPEAASSLARDKACPDSRTGIGCQANIQIAI